MKFLLTLLITCFIFSVKVESTTEISLNDLNLDSILSDFSHFYKSLPIEKREKRGTEKGELSQSSSVYSDYANESDKNAISSSDKNSSLECITTVLEDLHTNLKRIFPKLNDTSVVFKLQPDRISGVSNRRWFSLFSLTSFEKFCSYYNKTRKNLDLCPSSPIKGIALDTLSIVDFMCLKRYNDVVTYFPCLKKNDEVIYEPCQKNCSSLVAKDFENTAKSNSTKSDASKVFQSDCKHMTCVINCESPIIEAKCKSGAKKLVNDAVSVVFTSLEELIVNKLKFDWPKSCHDLTKMTTV